MNGGYTGFRKKTATDGLATREVGVRMINFFSVPNLQEPHFRAPPPVLDVGAIGARVYLQGKEPSLKPTPHYPGAPPGFDLFPGRSRSWLSFEIGSEQVQPFAGTSLVQWEIEGLDVEVMV